ncbi:hypothetical protein KAW08_04655 [bacterium]|nr:hypothetical protein [bacterium]
MSNNQYVREIIWESLPDIVIPNEITRKTFKSADSGRDIIMCKNADDMFKNLGI